LKDSLGDERLKRDRRGVGALFAVVALLSAMLVVAATQYFSASQARMAVEQTNLAEIADLQAQSYLEELRGAFGQLANQRDSALFKKLRRTLDDGWSELELTEDLPTPVLSVEPRWGSRRAELPVRLRPVLVRHQVRLRSPRTFAGGLGGEEWVALLSIDVEVEASDATRTLSSALGGNYEVRMLRPGPPPPFDQLGLLIGDWNAVTRVSRAGELRSRLLKVHEDLRLRIRALAKERPDVRERLTELEKGMKPLEEVEEATPKIPGGPAMLFGPYHQSESYSSELLDLTSLLGTRFRATEASLRDLEAAATGPKKVLEEAAFQAISRLGMALETLWLHRWQFSLLEVGGADYQARLKDYLPQLQARGYLDRVHRAIPSKAKFWKQWLKGRRSLDGTIQVALQPGESFGLSGTYRGRASLVVVGGRLEVGDLAPAGPESWDDLLVVVSLGAEVIVKGQARCSVIMLEGPGGSPPGRLRLSLGSELHGTLLAPISPPGSLELGGLLRYDPRFRLPRPPSKSLGLPGAGPYVVVVESTPLYVEAVKS
jgi:hypothetical protein